MPQVDSQVITFLAVMANILVQAVKGLLSEEAKRWIPLGTMVLMATVGALLAVYGQRDLVAGVFEGFLAGAASVGLYELEMNVPGVRQVFTSDGQALR